VERIKPGAVCEELQPMGRTHFGEVHGGLSPMGGAEDKHGKEGVTKCYELTTTPFSHPPVPLEREEVKSQELS